MSWTDFLLGALSTAFAYALFSQGFETETDEEETDDAPVNETDSVANKHVKIYCQGCRKIKSHKEVQPRLFQCTRCKRQTDVRVS